MGLVYKIENRSRITRKCNLSKLNQEEIKTNTIKPEAKKNQPNKKPHLKNKSSNNKEQGGFLHLNYDKYSNNKTILIIYKFC